MDLRIQKTIKNIHAAFLTLAGQKPIARITVKDICEQALINKSTFYAHYENIETLVEVIEDEFVAKLTGDIDYAYLFFTDPERFQLKLMQTFWSLPEARVLLADEHSGNLLRIILESLRRAIYKERPEIKTIPNIDMALTYIISGMSGVITMHRHEPAELRAAQIGRATTAILKAYLTP